MTETLPAGPPGEVMLGGPEHPVRVVLETVRVDPPGTFSAQHRAGRRAARAALRRAGSAVTAVGRRPGGAPVFPAGFAGSLTHTASVAVAAVAPGARGVGVDLEHRCPAPRLHRFLLDDTERALLWPDGDRVGLRRLFAAKEAAFKALTDCRQTHGGLFWRVRLRSHEGRLWACAGDAYALVREFCAPAFAFAVAVRVDRPPAALEPLFASTVLHPAQQTST
ncbi:4'-phosphopantetheinyl transferase superfamily protein [Streptomyces sp. NPDC051041]|uniref:4'-phosphopantetheinyl transferase superfamily protein n=1 Tax=Streptomyces sp. NPDC051041 TaxID=3365640 RepID=UPI0037B551E9